MRCVGRGPWFEAAPSCCSDGYVQEGIAGRNPRSDPLVVKINPTSARNLWDVGAKDLGVLEGRRGIKIVLRSTESIEAGAFELVQTTAAP